MNSQYLAILIGGIIPAFCFGLTGILAKASMDKGIDIASYLFSVGVGVIAYGIAALFIVSERSFNITSGAYAAGAGLIWAVGISMFTYALVVHKASVSAITPFHSGAVLVSVLLAFAIFAEWKTVNVPLLLIGSIFMIAGGAIVAKAS
jgi:drug/metabolite transporter (DMT)-like permease